MPGFPATPVNKRPKKSSGDFLGSIGHVISGTSKGLYHGLTGAPTGAYMTARAIGHDVGNAVTKHPFGYADPINYLTSLATGRTGQIGKAVAKQEYESWRHFGKGGDISGPILDASALVTGGATTVARTSKALSEISKASKVARVAKASELSRLDAGVMLAKGSGVSPGVGFDKAAAMLKTTSKDLKRHARAQENQLGLAEGNMSVGKAPGQYGKYANDPPHKVLKNPKHELFDFYAARYPEQISNATRARKAFMAKPLYERNLLEGKPFNKTKSPLKVPTSPNPIFRGIRAGIEQARPAKSAAREVLKEDVRRKVTQARFGAPKHLRIVKPLTDPGTLNKAEKALSFPMGALRMAMWMRPRYYLQNMAQTGQMIGANPILTAKSMKLASELRKTNKPVYDATRAVTGEAQAGALASGTTPSALGKIIGKRIPGRVGKAIQEKGVQGAMGYAANVPESHVRAISVLNELQKHNRAMGSLGDLTPAKVEQYFNNVRRSGVISPEHMPLRRAVENVGDFSRIYSARMLKHRGMGEREFMKTQIPIFYPMFKALSRYGARMASENPAQLASTVALGKQGKIEQKRLLGDLPFWAQYLVPKSAGDPNAHRSPHQAVFNPANIYNLQPGTDIARQTAELTRKGGPNPGISYLQESGPAPAIAYGLLTGKDWQTGYPIKPFSKSTYKKHPGLNRSIVNVPYDWASSLPGSDIGRLISGTRPHVRSYTPGSTRNRLLMELGPGPAFIPRTLRTKETTKQAKREKRYGQGRIKKKKPAYDG